MAMLFPTTILLISSLLQDLPGRTQFGTGGSRVRCDFRIFRNYRLARKHTKRCFRPRRLFPERHLHHPILQRVKADHRNPPARGEMGGKTVEKIGERLEFPVYGDPERLEHPGGRMDRPRPRFPGDGRFDQVRKLGGALDPFPLSLRNEVARDPPRKSLLPEPEEDVGQLPFGRTPKDLAGTGAARPGIPPHVQGAVAAEREPAGRIVQLRGGYPQVQQHPVEHPSSRRLAQPSEVGVVGPDHPDPGKPAEAPGSHRKHRRVVVGADEKARGPYSLRDLFRVSARARGPVEEYLSGNGGQQSQSLL